MSLFVLPHSCVAILPTTSPAACRLPSYILHLASYTSQVWCGCCSHAERRALRCTFKSPPGVPQPTDDAGRQVSWSLSDAYADQLGSALLPLLAAIPAGVLVLRPLKPLTHP